MQVRMYGASLQIIAINVARDLYGISELLCFIGWTSQGGAYAGTTGLLNGPILSPKISMSQPSRCMNRAALPWSIAKESVCGMGLESAPRSLVTWTAYRWQ